MKKFILTVYLLVGSDALIGMNRDLYFLCNETQECCTCLESVIEISSRSPKGSVLALPCCYTGDKAKREEVTVICDSCFGRLKKFDRPPTFAEQAATEPGQFKTQFCCPVCRGDLKKNIPVPLTDDNIVHGAQPKKSVVQPTVTKSERLPLFRGVVLKQLKNNTLKDQTASLLIQFPQFDQSDIDIVTRSYTAVQNNRLLALIVANASVGYALFLVAQMLSEEDLDLLAKSAQNTQQALLTFNVDLANPLLPLASQYDISKILKTIDNEVVGQELARTITLYDTLLASVHQAITTRYYYQTADYFKEKEQPLVTQLQEARTNLEASIRECKKYKKPSRLGLAKLSCAAVLASICGYYWATANPLKRWGLF